MQSPAPVSQEDPGSTASGFAGPAKTRRPASRMRVGLMDVASGAFRDVFDNSEKSDEAVLLRYLVIYRVFAVQDRWH